jgi:hypothetical protein
MTTPTPTGAGFVARALSSPRALAAWASVGYAGLVLFFAFIDWILPGGDGTFSGRSASADFVGTYTIALPVLAVLLAAHLNPVLEGAKLIATIALIEYAVMLFFGLVTLLIGLGSVFEAANDVNDVFDALAYLVLGLAQLVLVAVAAMVVWQAFERLGGKLPIGRTRPVPPA